MSSHTGVRGVLHAWHVAKGFGIAMVVSLAAGWLTRELLTGKMSADNKAAAWILDLTLAAMLTALGIIGFKRWRDDQLTPSAKLMLVLSIVLLIAFFVIGWTSDLKIS